jgi:hypothetical protein
MMHVATMSECGGVAQQHEKIFFPTNSVLETTNFADLEVVTLPMAEGCTNGSTILRHSSVQTASNPEEKQTSALQRGEETPRSNVNLPPYPHDPRQTTNTDPRAPTAVSTSKSPGDDPERDDSDNPMTGCSTLNSTINVGML